MANKVYFGVPGAVREIPAPDSGLGFTSNAEAEVTQLVSGGQSVWRPATAYRSFDMSWRGSSKTLRTLIDMFNGQYGPGPFYITDPSANQLNVLPPRWANSWQLAHQANGWCRPVVEKLTNFPSTPNIADAFTDRQVVFTQNSLETTTVTRTNLITNPSFEVNTTGWTVSGATIARTTGFPQMVKSGTAIAQVTSDGTSPAPYAAFSGVPVTAGQWLGVKEFLASELTGNIQVRLYVSFRDGSNVETGNAGTTYVKASFYTGTFAQLTAQAPANTVTAVVYAQFRNGDDTVSNLASGQRLWVEAVQAHTATTQALAQAALDQGYFDGSTASGGNVVNGANEIYRWTGTAHASTSNALSLPSYAAGGKLKMRVIRIPNMNYYFACDGDTTSNAGIKIRGYSESGSAWVDLQTVTNLDGVSRQVTGLTSDMTMIELDVYVPLFATLKLRGMSLGTILPQLPGTILRTNQILNPTPASTTGYSSTYSSGTGTLTYNTSESEPFVRNTKDGTAGLVSIRINTAATAITAGVKVSARAWVRSSAALSVQWRDQGVAIAGNTALTANTWTAITLTNYTTTASTFRLEIWTTSNMPAAGTLDVKQIMWELATTPGVYFSGSTVTDGTNYYYWTGTADNSTSVATDMQASTYMPSGNGTGALQFNSAGQGTLVSSVIDRIGLALTLTEVQQVERISVYG